MILHVRIVYAPDHCCTAVCGLYMSRFWIEKARRKRQKRCAFLIARSYGPGLKNRLH